MIPIALFISNITQHLFKSINPCSWRLFETVQRFLQLTNLSNCLNLVKPGVISIYIYIYLLLKITMQKSILYIQLMQKGNQNLQHMKSMFLLYSFLPQVQISHHNQFHMFDCILQKPIFLYTFLPSFQILLHSKDPLATNNSLTWR